VCASPPDSSWLAVLLCLLQSTVNEVTGPKALSEYELGDQVRGRIHPRTESLLPDP